jgi:hypothetical protein
MGWSRAVWNDQCYFWNAFDGVPTGFGPYAGPFDCRYVPQTQIFPSLGPLGLRTAWVTCSAAPVGALVSAVDYYYQMNWQGANVVTLDGHPGVFFLPLLPEYVTPTGETAYWRWSVTTKWW